MINQNISDDILLPVNHNHEKIDPLKLKKDDPLYPT